MLLRTVGSRSPWSPGSTSGSWPILLCEVQEAVVVPACCRAKKPDVPLCIPLLALPCATASANHWMIVLAASSFNHMIVSCHTVCWCAPPPAGFPGHTASSGWHTPFLGSQSPKRWPPRAPPAPRSSRSPDQARLPPPHQTTTSSVPRFSRAETRALQVQGSRRGPASSEAFSPFESSRSRPHRRAPGPERIPESFFPLRELELLCSI